ncbi:Crp/Fnr family transcriptional regulator [Nitrosospira sp. Nsp13]|uniref:Crp/Fnr family transcriptional regulator n=1 Tax=Nitrosospira sp. Nsp13 TaxID=1855332 RepID=UPI00088A855B|nr:Crp/Fnr family transcriptional regulator [Nitrosospira sp. Nsp13]SCY58194.1 cAMP-binding domain of CRP or a regulatory subunit of cAMP-dependent protein kinases [Nitrosospira sp. Nsp13]
MVLSQNTAQNRILSGLSPADYSRLQPTLEFVNLAVGEGIYEPDSRITYLYFPIDCIIARLYELDGGGTVKTSVTGNEGMVGISYLLGSESTSARTVVLKGGSAVRIKAFLLKKEFECGGVLQRSLLRFTQALFLQTEQIAIGNQLHTIEQRLSHFLLMILDRMSGNELYITHEQVGVFLGVRRESVTTAAQKLETTGAIECRRGHMSVTDRGKLEVLAGENYVLISKEYKCLHAYGSC